MIYFDFKQQTFLSTLERTYLPTEIIAATGDVIDDKNLICLLYPSDDKRRYLDVEVLIDDLSRLVPVDFIELTPGAAYPAFYVWQKSFIDDGLDPLHQQLIILNPLGQPEIVVLYHNQNYIEYAIYSYEGTRIKTITRVGVKENEVHPFIIEKINNLGHFTIT